MIRRSLAAAIALAALLCTAVNLPKSAFAAAALSPKPQGTEVAFLTGIQKDLNARFATIAQAKAAGYFRYTNEDNTGAISYANLHWTSSDPQHPSQLWYSAQGKLLGADFSVPAMSATPPHLWGVNPKRWTIFGAHMHYVVDVNGKETYGYALIKKFVAAGGNIHDPQPQTIVALHKAKSASEVKHVFLFPKIWDLDVWVTPNPSGAFAEKNPLVHPSKKAATTGM